MQKKLIVLAIAGVASTAAFAQSNVTISGQLKAGFDQYRISNDPAGTTNGKQNMITDQTSSFVLKGTESLGNGLNAIFQIDNRFTVDGTAGNTTLGTGNTYVGLASASLGEFKLGRHDLHYNEIERIENGSKSLSQQAMVGRGLLNQVNGTFIGAANTRTANVVMWDSPNFGGVTGRLAYSTAPAGNEGATNAGGGAGDGGSALNGVVRYEGNGVKTGYSYYNQKTEGGAVAGSSQESNRVWGAYTIAGFSIGAAWDRSEIYASNTASSDGKSKRDAWAIPLSYTMGNHGFYATYAQAKSVKGGAAPTTDTKAKQYMLGYDYSLSKRTSVGVNYTKLDNKVGASYDFANIKSTATVTGADTSQIYMGVRHAY